MLTHQASVGKLERMSLSPLDHTFLERHPHHFAKITGATQFLFTLTLLDSCRLGDRMEKLGMMVSTCEAKDLSQGASDRLNE